MTCNDCVHAKWQLKKNGHRRSDKPGQCMAPYVLDDAPAAVRMVHSFRETPAKSAIWLDDPIGDCPAYEKKGDN